MMILRKSALMIAVLLAPSLALSSTLTSDPGKAVESTVGKVREAVISKKDKLSKSELNSELEEIIRPVFNFDGMARRCLGQNWKKGNAEQQKQFITLFSELLSNTYLGRISRIDESTVSFVGERVKGNKALIKTSVNMDGQDFPIHYRMKLKNEKWRVYDVVIENISLVSNYRSEFSSIVRKKGFDGLITLLKDKKAKREKKS